MELHLIAHRQIDKLVLGRQPRLVLHQYRLLHHNILLRIELLILIDHLDIDCLRHPQPVIEVLQNWCLRHTICSHQVRREGLLLVGLQRWLTLAVEHVRHWRVSVVLRGLVLRHLLMVALYRELMRIDLVLQALVLARLVSRAALLVLRLELNGSVEHADWEQGVRHAAVGVLAGWLAHEAWAVHGLQLAGQVLVRELDAIAAQRVWPASYATSEKLVAFGPQLRRDVHLAQALRIDLVSKAATLVHGQVLHLRELHRLLQWDLVLLLLRHHLLLGISH